VLEFQVPKLKTQNQQFSVLMTTPKSPILRTLTSPKTDIAVSKLKLCRKPYLIIYFEKQH
jgi:hypothetical protein